MNHNQMVSQLLVYTPNTRFCKNTFISFRHEHANKEVNEQALCTKVLITTGITRTSVVEHSVCWKVCLSGEKYNKAEKQSQERLQSCKI
jgi:hypothetical protein